MGIHLSVSTASYEPIQEGTHTAVCDKIIDLGKQVGLEEFGGRVSPKLYIGWLVADEIDGELNTKEKHIGRIYTASLDRKSSLRKDLEAWRGRPFTEEELADFDMDKVLGTGCMLNVVHVQKGDRIRESINGIVALPRGMKVEKPKDSISFVLNKDTVGDVDLLGIPAWLVDMIRNSVTYKELMEPELAEDVFKTDEGFHVVDF